MPRNSSTGTKVDDIEAAMAKWMALYDKLKEARAKLKAAMEQPGPVPAALNEEVRECERRCGAALNELNEAFAQNKGAPPPATRP